MPISPAEVTSAGTIVGAVMETAGYVAQSEILKDFEPFFGGAGALFYIIAALGGVVSVLVFGSYRMAQYLLLGPALFWWLVGTTSMAHPVVWRLGDGDIQDVTPGFVGELESYKPQSDDIPVSTFFRWYTTIIGNVVNTVSGAILEHENDEDLLMLARNQVLDLVLNMRPQREELFNMLKDSLFGIDRCEEMMKTAISLSNYNLSPQMEDILVKRTQANPPDPQAAQTLQKLRDTRASLQNDYNVLARVVITPGPAFKEFVRKRTESSINGTGGKNYTNVFRSTQGHSPQDFITKDVGSLTATCGEVWLVNRDKILEEAEWLLGRGLDQHIQGKLATDRAAAERLICEEIGKKLHRDYVGGGTGTCNIVETAGLYMLRKVISDHSLHSQRVQRAKDKMGFIQGKNGYIWTDIGEDQRMDSDFDDRKIVLPEGERLEIDVREGAGLVARDVGQEIQRYGQKLPNGDSRQIWRPFTSISAPGMMEVAYTEQQRYQSRGLMQGIFTYALSLPYWQGVILYFLSMAYPFFALLVIVPGRAQAFFYMPLAWFWVKSWDIGFALVIVLDKILWNLLPPTDIPHNPLSSNPDAEMMPSVLQQALKIDPSYDVHAHYNFVSMALFAIPGLTGAAIMKARSSVLGSFTSGPQAAADDAKNIGEGMNGVGIMNKRLQDMFRLAGTGAQIVGMRGQSMTSDGRGGDAALYAGAVGLLQMVNYGATSAGGKERGGDNSGGARLARAGNKAIQTGADAVNAWSGLVVAEALVAKERIKMDDAVFGRWGRMQKMMEASASGVDGGGGFEINAHHVQKDLNKANLALFKERVKMVSSGVDELADLGLWALVGNKGARQKGETIGGDIAAYLPSGIALRNATRSGGDLTKEFLDDNENAALKYYQSDPFGVFHQNPVDGYRRRDGEETEEERKKREAGNGTFPGTRR